MGGKTMKTKFQKVLALVLAMLMLVSVAACAPAATSSKAPENTGSSAGTPSTGTESKGDDADLYYNKTGFPICDETIKVVAKGPISDPENPFKDTYLHKHWVENYGIEVDWQMYENEMWKTQLTTLVTSDELPDMLFNSNTTINQAHEYGDEGYFADWNDYKELAPNTFKRFEDHPDWALFLTSPNGGIYGLGQYSGWPHEILCRVYLREDWLKNLNLEAPTTVDQVYDVLKAFKEKDANKNGDPNDEIPLVMYGNTYIYCMFLAAFGINVEKANWNLPLVINKEGKVELAATSDNYKAFIEYFIKLYKDGLIDATSFSDTNDEMKAKGKTMNVGMHGEVPFLFRSTAIGADADSITLGGLTSSYNDVKYVGLSYGLTSKDVDHIICADSKYKEALIRLLDYYNGDGNGKGEGMEEGNAGPWGAEYAEGVTWTYAKDKVTGFNVRDLFREESGVDLEKFNSDEVFRARKATINGLSMFTTIDFIGRGTLYRVDDETLLSKESLDLYGWAATGEALMRRKDVTLVGPTDRFPAMAYTEAESKDSADYGTAVRTLIDTLFVQYVTGQKEFDFEDFKTQLKNAGLDKLLAAEQSAYDRYIKNA